MKQFFLIPTCALVAAVTVTSCQREEKSCVELATELTIILKKVNDYESAEAAAPAVKVYMERLSAALGRPVAHGGSALYKSESGELKNALEELARQIARVRASYPEQMQAATFTPTDENQAASEAPIDAAVKALTQNVTKRLQGDAAGAYAKYAAKTITDAEKDQLVTYSKGILKALSETQAGMAEIAALGKLVNVSTSDAEDEEESEDSEEESSVASEDVDAGDASAVDAYLKKCMKEQQAKYNAANAAKAEAVLAAVQTEHYDAVIKSASKLINTLVSYKGGESSEIPTGFVPAVKYLVDSGMGDASDEEKAARLERVNELVTVIGAERLLLQKGVTPVRVAEVCFSTVGYMVDNNISVETDDSLLQHLGANLGIETPAEGEEEGSAGDAGQIKTSRAAESLAQGNVYLNTFAPNTSSGTTYAPTSKDPVNDMEGADGKVIAFAECYGSVALQEAFGDFIRLGDEDASTKPVIDKSIWSFDGAEAAPAAPEVDWNAVNAARKAVETTDAPAEGAAVEGETVTEVVDEPVVEDDTVSEDAEEETTSEEETETEEPAVEDEEETSSDDSAVEEEEETSTDDEEDTTSDEPAAEEEEEESTTDEPAAEEEEESTTDEPAVEEEEETSSDEEEETSSDDSSDEEEVSSDDEEESSSDDDFGFGDIEF